MGHIETSTGLEIVDSPALFFVKHHDRALLTPEVAFHISRALGFPNVEETRGKKDIMHAVRSENGRAGLFLFSPLPEFVDSRPERVILGYEGANMKGGILLFGPTSIVTDMRFGQIVVRKEVEGYENSFTFDRNAKLNEHTDIKKPVILM
jgi:hypothetical protein